MGRHNYGALSALFLLYPLQAAAEQQQPASEGQDALGQMVNTLGRAQPEAPRDTPRVAPRLREPLDKEEVTRHLGDLSFHPQVDRAQQLRSKRPGQARLSLTPAQQGSASAKAVAQATDEYRRFFALARALPTKRTAGSKAPAILGGAAIPGSDGAHQAKESTSDKTRCAVITKVKRALDRGSGAAPSAAVDARSRDKTAPSGALGLSADPDALCSSRARQLADEAATLQRIFGQLPGWAHFYDKWLAVLVGKKLRRTKVPARLKYVGY